MVVGKILSVMVGDVASNNADEVGQLTLQAWKYVFYLSATVYLVSGTIFVLFGANTVQSWNDPPLKSTLTASKYKKNLDANWDWVGASLTNLKQNLFPPHLRQIKNSADSYWLRLDRGEKKDKNQ